MAGNFSVIIRLVPKIFKLLIDIICPRFCVVCGKHGDYVCNVCGEDLQFMVPEPVKLAVTTNYLDGVWALATYQGMIKALIKQLKYKGVKDLATVGAYYLYNFANFPTVDYLACIPIHKKRFKERGFNQSRELAIQLAKLSKLEFVPLLKRDLYREKQALSKDKAERERKVRSVFSLNKLTKNYPLPGKSILLIDDVVTTGATLNECARILRKAGATKIYALCLAHGV